MSRRKEDEKAGQSEREPFLGRWSRHKQAAQRREVVAESVHAAALSDGAVKSSDADTSQGKTPPLKDADMPSLKDLDGDSDYAGFLSTDVSEELRRMALRQLFHSAQFNICDGLDDYDEDFTSFEKLGDIVTADMKHRMDMEAPNEVAESTFPEPKPEEDADLATDEPVQEGAVREDEVNEPVDRAAIVDKEAARLGDNDNENDSQSVSTPDADEQSSS